VLKVNFTNNTRWKFVGEPILKEEVRQYLRGKYKIDIRVNHKIPDVVWCFFGTKKGFSHISLERQLSLLKGKPLIYWENNPASWGVRDIEVFKYSNLKIFLKQQSMLSSSELYDIPFYNRFHFDLLLPYFRGLNLTGEQRICQRFDSKTFSKITILFNNVLHGKIHKYLVSPLFDSRFSKKKKYSLFWSGGIHNRGSDVWNKLYYLYRKSVYDRMVGLKLKDKFLTKKVLGYREYSEATLSSKIVISPWGFGEICWRDFEAMCLGAVVIKPDMGHLVTYPDVYVPYKTYIPCSYDCSDMKEQVNYVLDNWDNLEELRYNAFQTIKKAWEPENIAEKIHIMLKVGKLV